MLGMNGHAHDAAVRPRSRRQALCSPAPAPAPPSPPPSDGRCVLGFRVLSAPREGRGAERGARLGGSAAPARRPLHRSPPSPHKSALPPPAWLDARAHTQRRSITGAGGSVLSGPGASCQLLPDYCQLFVLLSALRASVERPFKGLRVVQKGLGRAEWRRAETVQILWMVWKV